MENTKLHLGCGQRFFPGFIHVDIADYPHIDFVSPVDKLDFIACDSISLIYASHVLEYFDLAGIEGCLHEWKRVLKPGGFLRLSVPNFRALMAICEVTSDIKSILGPLFGRMKVGERSEDLIYHRVVFDYELLETTLSTSGFDEISTWNWRNTEHSEIDDHSQAFFPHMDKERGIQVSLNIEARKPLIED